MGNSERNLSQGEIDEIIYGDRVASRTCVDTLISMLRRARTGLEHLTGRPAAYQRAGATMLWKVAGSVLVVREAAQDPSDAEWNEFIHALVAYRRHVDVVRVLVVTDGGGPNTAQRDLIKDAIGASPFRSAVVSDAIKIRFIASAIMLISKNHASFTTTEADRAYDHLVLTADERDAVVAALRVLEGAIQRVSVAA